MAAKYFRNEMKAWDRFCSLLKLFHSGGEVIPQQTDILITQSCLALGYLTPLQLSGKKILCHYLILL